MAQAIETARQARAEEDTWPQLHYLWPQHPIMDWLGDRVLTHFGRHRAPLLQSPKLQPGEQAFILMSLVPNRKGQPLLVEWQVASRVHSACGRRRSFALEPFDSFVKRAGLKAGKLPNRGHRRRAGAIHRAMQDGPAASGGSHARPHAAAAGQRLPPGLKSAWKARWTNCKRLQGQPA
jgi:hypothetical protein